MFPDPIPSLVKLHRNVLDYYLCRCRRAAPAQWKLVRRARPVCMLGTVGSRRRQQTSFTAAAIQHLRRVNQVPKKEAAAL